MPKQIRFFDSIDERNPYFVIKESEENGYIVLSISIPSVDASDGIAIKISKEDAKKIANAILSVAG